MYYVCHADQEYISEHKFEKTYILTKSYSSSVLLYIMDDIANCLTINDLNLVYSETYEARSKWQNILLELGVGKHSIDSISKKWRENPDDCYREGLSEWLNGDGRSWKNIANALTRPTVNLSNIASKLRKNYPIQQAGTTHRIIIKNVSISKIISIYIHLSIISCTYILINIW